MDNLESKHTENPNKPHKPIEHDYARHDTDPGPSPEAVKESNSAGAGPAMKWIIPVVLIILFALYWIFFRV